MIYGVEQSVTREMLSDASISGVDHTAMIEEDLFRGLARNMKDNLTEFIEDSEDQRMGTVKFSLRLSVESLDERRRKLDKIMHIMIMNDVSTDDMAEVRRILLDNEEHNNERTYI